MSIDGELGLNLISVIVGALVLLGLVVLVSNRLGLGVERSVVWAGARASAQLIAVGLLFRVIFESPQADIFSWLWVGVMCVIAVVVLLRRAPSIPSLWIPAAGSILATTAVALAVIFGLGVLEVEPVSLVVIAGLTIGNSMPSGVSGVRQVVAAARERPGELDALLALGMTRRHVVRYLAPPAAALALVPQIERTKVVGLIALPGAMAGLLLAGADPLEAVILQLLVMLLVLGAVALSTMILSVAVSRGAVTGSLQTAPWVTSHESTP